MDKLTLNTDRADGWLVSVEYVGHTATKPSRWKATNLNNTQRFAFVSTETEDLRCSQKFADDSAERMAAVAKLIDKMQKLRKEQVDMEPVAECHAQYIGYSQRVGYIYLIDKL